MQHSQLKCKVLASHARGQRHNNRVETVISCLCHRVPGAIFALYHIMHVACAEEGSCCKELTAAMNLHRLLPYQKLLCTAVLCSVSLTRTHQWRLALRSIFRYSPHRDMLQDHAMLGSEVDIAGISVSATHTPPRLHGQSPSLGFRDSAWIGLSQTWVQKSFFMASLALL